MIEDLMENCKKNTYTIDEICDVFGLEIPRPKHSPKKLNRELNKKRHIFTKRNSTTATEKILDRPKRQFIAGAVALGVVAVTSLV